MSSLVADVSTALREKHFTLVSAESCTGGMIAAALTDLAGSSDIFDRGLVTYSNQAKMDLLGVPADILSVFGAVSAQTCGAMVAGALSHTKADVAVAVTGIAGPSGGSPDKPVGLVYIGAGQRGHAPVINSHIFVGSRADVRLQARNHALQLVLDLLSLPAAME
ncbi:MAG: CinA family protein [Pseudobdellovibrionaceae bacterium]